LKLPDRGMKKKEFKKRTSLTTRKKIVPGVLGWGKGKAERGDKSAKIEKSAARRVRRQEAGKKQQAVGLLK